MDVEFQEKGDETRWCWAGGVEGEEDVAFCVDKFEKDLGCEMGTETFGFWGEEEQVVVVALS